MKSLTLIRKISEIAQSIQMLEKLDRNPHHKYSFVSIDDYYAHVARAVMSHGVFWTVTEKSVKISDEVTFTYEFTVYDTDTGDHLDPIHISVPHPFQGAQTAGAAMSYAEKVFMRSMFKVVTGEPDSDALEAPARKAKSKKDPAPSVDLPSLNDDPLDADGKSFDAPAFYARVSKIFEGAPSLDDLEYEFNQDKGGILRLKVEAPPLFAALQKVYSERKSALIEER